MMTIAGLDEALPAAQEEPASAIARCSPTCGAPGQAHDLRAVPGNVNHGPADVGHD
jgi:hypothetical protein